MSDLRGFKKFASFCNLSALGAEGTPVMTWFISFLASLMGSSTVSSRLIQDVYASSCSPLYRYVVCIHTHCGQAFGLLLISQCREMALQQDVVETSCTDYPRIAAMLEAIHRHLIVSIVCCTQVACAAQTGQPKKKP